MELLFLFVAELLDDFPVDDELAFELDDELDDVFSITNRFSLLVSNLIFEVLELEVFDEDELLVVLDELDELELLVVLDELDELELLVVLDELDELELLAVLDELDELELLVIFDELDELELLVVSIIGGGVTSGAFVTAISVINGVLFSSYPYGKSPRIL